MRDWSEEDQHNWLKMFAMGMQVVYGGRIAECISPLPVAGAVIIQPEVVGIPSAPLEPVTKPSKYHIDASGYVRNTKTGQAVNVEDVDTDEIFDMRGPKSNLETIIWANGETGANGYDGVITA